MLILMWVINKLAKINEKTCNSAKFYNSLSS